MTDDIPVPPAPTSRTVFFVSDGTGITAETFGHAVLSQFEMRFRQIRLPFIDSIEKAHEAARRGRPIDPHEFSARAREVVFSLAQRMLPRDPAIELALQVAVYVSHP